MKKIISLYTLRLGVLGLSVLLFTACGGRTSLSLDEESLATLILKILQNGKLKEEKKILKEVQKAQKTLEQSINKELNKTPNDLNLKLEKEFTSNNGYGGLRLLAGVGDTLFTAAARSGDIDMVKFLLEIPNKNKKVKKKNININIDETGLNHQTALMFAARQSNVEMVELLLSKEADVNFQNKFGSTALFEAVCAFNDRTKDFEACKKVVKLLLQKGANPNRTPSHSTPLLEAINSLRHNHNGETNPPNDTLEPVLMLLRCGAKVNVVDENGYSSLTNAVELENLKLVRLLIKHGAELHIANEEKGGETALVVAVRTYHKNVDRNHSNNRLLIAQELIKADVSSKFVNEALASFTEAIKILEFDDTVIDFESAKNLDAKSKLILAQLKTKKSQLEQKRKLL